MRPAALLLVLLAAIPGCKDPEPPAPPTNEQRIAALGLHRDPLPDADNPILALKEPLETFLEETDGEFVTDHPPATFLDFHVSAETQERCWDLQKTLRETIDRGPGRIPEPSPDDFNIYFIQQARLANAALAAKSLDDDNPSDAAFHLAFTLELADYLLESDPLLIPYSYTVLLKHQTFRDLLLLHQAAPSPALRTQITAICQNSRFKPRRLEAALRTDAIYSLEIGEDLRSYLEKQHEAHGSLVLSFSQPPLSKLTIEQVLALPYDAEASIGQFLDQFEATSRWIASGLPLSRGPRHLFEQPAPKSLDYYQSAPNGLHEIFLDCQIGRPGLVALVTHQILDAQIEIALAWLQAEAAGIAVTSLDALVPGYLERIPADPCDGNPFRCIPEKRLIYSIGPDLKDDKGRSVYDIDRPEGNGLDRTLTIPAGQPAPGFSAPPSPRPRSAPSSTPPGS